MKRTVVMLSLLAAVDGARAAVPSPEQVRSAWRSSESVLLDRHGEPIQALRVDLSMRRLPWVALGDMSPALPAAVLQAEDQRFTQHGGVDVRAAGQAAWENLFRDKARGASTITMQLAGLLDSRLRGGADGRSWGQKWDQVQAARELEQGWTKGQILEAYLNMVSFRGELQGIAAASRGLFGKAPSGLNQTEAIVLASLLRAPAAAPKTVARRACALAKELKAVARCSAIEWEVAIALGRPAAIATLTPAPQVARKLLTGASRQVRSTLDGTLQRFAQASLRQHLMALRERNVNDGAVVVIDNDSGELLAYVGNGGDSEVDGVAALRQAGSTLKPFLYQMAIEKQLITAASVLDDSPINIQTEGGLYIPQNYDRQFKGFVSTRTSLASSLNVPAVRTLLMTGLEPFHQRLRAVGISSLTESAEYYGYSLALGSAEVSLLELANAYRTLANGGMVGTVTLQPRAAQAKRRVLDARASFIVADILSDRAARSLTFGLRNELATTFWSAVKTGTSKDMRDNWCVGFSEKYTVGVWVGNFDGRPMWDVSGVTGAAPVWRDVMDHLHGNLPSRAPSAPGGVLRQQLVYQPALEAPRSEWFIQGTESAVVEVVAGDQRAPAILYPGTSTIIALDPDIPSGRQRVFFQAQAGQGLRWQLDGEVLGSGDADFGWRPVTGEHELALVNLDGKTVAHSRFQVRGAAHQTAKEILHQ